MKETKPKCPKCGSTYFRIYHSKKIKQCDKCLTEYKLDTENIEIKHQRG